MGAGFQLENRYAQIVGCMFIVMVYSSAMPILYFSGFLLSVTMYWSDKVLFLRHYRTPPKYGMELATRSLTIIEYSIALHLLFGMYMLTNPEIFKVDDGKGIAWANSYSMRIGDWMHVTLGSDEKRFQSVHGVIYLFGSLLFFILFFVERTLGALTRLFHLFCCCLHSQYENENFSTNIYQDLSPDDLRYEYAATEQLIIKQERALLLKENLSARPVILYHVESMKLKLKKIKLQLV